MPITNEELSHLAKLSRIALSEEEKTKLGGEINQIMTMVEQLQECDVEGIEPMAHPHEGVSLKPRKIDEST